MRARWSAALITAVVLALGVRAAGADEVRPLRAVEDRVLFSGRGADTGIFEVRADGSDLRRVTDHAAQPPWPARDRWVISPEGTQVVREHRVIDVLTGAQTAYADGDVDSTDADWSPEGLRLVYSQGYDWGVFVHDLVDGRRHTIDEGFHDDETFWTVRWAPQRETLMVSRFVFTLGSRPLTYEYLVESDGSDRRDFLEGARSGGFCGWAPDGEWFCFRDEDATLWVAPTEDPDAAIAVDEQVGRSEVWSPDSSSHLAYVAWSPDSSRLAYVRRAAEVGPFELWVADRDGTNRRMLTVELGETTVSAWSPDGRHIAGLTSAPGAADRYQVFVADVTTGEVRRVTDAELDMDRPHWTNDGGALIAGGVGADANGARRVGLYRIAPDGSGVVRLTGPTQAAVPEQRPFLNAAVVPERMGALVRVAGRDRVGTAVELSQRSHEAAPAAVVARADTYPDALAAAAVAAREGGPLLLTPSDRLAPAVERELRRLGVNRVFVMGTSAAISNRVVDQLRGTGARVERIGGADRYATAARVADRIGGEEAYLTRGADPHPARGWPDAVAVSGLSAHRGVPVLFTSPRGLPEPTRQALRGRKRVTIVGGPAAVPRTVDAELTRMGITVTRLAGADRYATSTAVADAAVAAGMPPGRLVAVTGGNWPDALAAGPLTATVGGVVLLVPGQTVPTGTPTARWINDHATDITEIVIAGGPTAITQQAAVDIDRHATPTR